MTLRRTAALIAAPALTLASLTLMAPAAQAAAPTNDDFASARVVGPALPVAATGSNVGATVQSGEPSEQTNGPGATVWYSWTAPADANVAVSTQGSETPDGDSLDTFVDVYTGTSLDTLSLVGSDDDSGMNGASVVTFDATGGTTYYVQVDGYHYDSGAETGSIDLSISELDATLSGTVTVAGSATPVADACVEATSSSYVVDTSTDEDGSYSVSLPAGTYGLHVSNCGSGASLLDADASGIVVAAHANVTHDVQLEPGGSISGTVTGPNGAAPSDVCVDAYNSDGSVDQGTDTDETGAYQIDNLPTGSYYLYFSDCGGQGLLGAYYGGTTDESASTQVAVTAGSVTSGKNIQLSRGASISGTISSANGAAVDNACADVYNDDVDRTGYVDDSGHYDVQSLPAGTYWVEFYQDCDASHPTTLWYGGSSTEAGSQTITLTAGQQKTGINAVFGQAPVTGPSAACTGARATAQAATSALGSATTKLHRDQSKLKKLGKKVKKAKGHAKSKLKKKQKKLKKTVKSDKHTVSTATTGVSNANAAVGAAC
jgi:hypothetical protein